MTETQIQRIQDLCEYLRETAPSEPAQRVRPKEVNAIQCPMCQDVVWSRHRHDFRNCECGAVAIDGGRDYVKVCTFESLPTPRIIPYEPDEKEWDC